MDNKIKENISLERDKKSRKKFKITRKKQKTRPEEIFDLIITETPEYVCTFYKVGKLKTFNWHKEKYIADIEDLRYLWVILEGCWV